MIHVGHPLVVKVPSSVGKKYPWILASEFIVGKFMWFEIAKFGGTQAVTLPTWVI